MDLRSPLWISGAAPALPPPEWSGGQEERSDEVGTLHWLRRPRFLRRAPPLPPLPPCEARRGGDRDCRVTW